MVMANPKNVTCVRGVRYAEAVSTQRTTNHIADTAFSRADCIYRLPAGHHKALDKDGMQMAEKALSQGAVAAGPHVLRCRGHE